jgi:hypothetical protein
LPKSYSFETFRRAKVNNPLFFIAAPVAVGMSANDNHQDGLVANIRAIAMNRFV